MRSSALLSKKHSICISDYMLITFFYLGRLLQKLRDDQWRSVTKGSIYHNKHMYTQPFTMGLDLPEILTFNGSICYALYNLKILHFYLVRQR